MSKIYLLMFLLFAPHSSDATSLAQPGVHLSVNKGRAPLTVSLSGPAVLLEKAKACQRIWGGMGFSIDWGDGSPRGGRVNENCTEQLKHTYTVPGRYSVQVSVFHPGPNDAPVYDYQGSGEVEVTGESGKGPVTVKALVGKEELAPLYYGTGLRPLRYLVNTTRPLRIKAELVKEDGSVILKEEKAVSNSGTDSFFWSAYGNGPAAEHYVKGKLRARYRLTALADGKEVAKDDSPFFPIHASATFRSFEVRPGSGKAPLEVTASSSFHHAECISYIVDWGDGSAPENGGTFSGKKSCPLTSHRVELTHKYSKPGKYTIRWHDNSGNPFAPALRNPGYMEKQVKVD